MYIDVKSDHTYSYQSSIDLVSTFYDLDQCREALGPNVGLILGGCELKPCLEFPRKILKYIH